MATNPIPKSIFVLPRGPELGGITSWSVRLAKHLHTNHESVELIKHQPMPGERHDQSALQGLPMVDCHGKAAWGVGLNDIMTYLPAYHGALPGMIVPNWTFGTYATCAVLSLTAPAEMRVLGVAHSDEDIYYQWLSYYESIIHTFVAVSDEIAATLRTLIPHRSEDIVVRPCAVIDRPPALSRTYSQVDQPICLMYAGRIQNQQKRIYDLLILARLLKQRQLRFRLNIFGSGSEEQWLRQKFEQWLGDDSGQTVKFFGSVPHGDMAGYWQQADVCVLVSDFEGTSISMLEAMSHGCVPIVTNVSGTKAVIQNGVNGFVVPIGEMGTMADKIEQLAQDRSVLEQVGQAAYDSVVNRFSTESYMEWFAQVRRNIWQKPPRQWPLGRTVLPERFQPPPPPTLGQRARNKLVRNVDKLRLSLKIRGLLHD